MVHSQLQFARFLRIHTVYQTCLKLVSRNAISSNKKSFRIPNTPKVYEL